MIGKWRKTAVWLLGMLLMLSMYASSLAATTEQVAGGTSVTTEQVAGDTSAVSTIQQVATNVLDSESRQVSDTALRTQVSEAIAKVAQYVSLQDEISEWGLIGLARGGYSLPAHALSDIEARVKQTDAQFSRVTDYERIALGVLAAGGDPRNVAGYDFLEMITTDAKLERQGPNGIIHALLLLESGDFTVTSEAQWTKERLIAWLIDAQKDDGGWSISAEGESNADITAMALAALAPSSNQDEVKAAVEQAVKYLSHIQREDGGFPGLSAERTAQIIIGLTANGIDPADGDFVKDKGNAVRYLLSMQLPDGSFAHLPDGDSDLIASEQALMALVAYDLFGKKHTSLFEGLTAAMVNVTVEGPNAPIGAGTAYGVTGLEALENWAESRGIKLGKTVYAFGTSVDGVDDIASGRYGGWDGWVFAVKRDEAWIHPTSGIDAFTLNDGDELLFYYSDNTKLIHSIAIAPLVPQSNKPFNVFVTTSEWDWENNAELILPAQDVNVTVGGVTAVTNEDGEAHFTGLSTGTYTIELDGYREDAAPTIVRSESEVYIAPGMLEEFSDAADVSDWAKEGVNQAIEYGLMKGTSREKALFVPAKTITRAEFAELLKALVPGTNGQGDAALYSDVDGGEWYADAVGVLLDNGVLDGEGLFRPHDNITREEIGVWVAKALQLQAESSKGLIRDLEQADDASRSFIRAVFEHGIIVGNNGYYRPLDPVTREEAALVAVRIYELVAVKTLDH